jgi:hypothetical protein
LPGAEQLSRLLSGHAATVDVDGDGDGEFVGV